MVQTVTIAIFKTVKYANIYNVAETWSTILYIGYVSTYVRDYLIASIPIYFLGDLFIIIIDVDLSS